MKTTEKTPFRVKMENSVAFNELSAICKANGYELTDAHYDNFLFKPVITIKRATDFQPEVLFYESWLNALKKEWPQFRIGTTRTFTGYIDDFKAYVDGLNKALFMVELLNKVDLSTLAKIDNSDY